MSRTKKLQSHYKVPGATLRWPNLLRIVLSLPSRVFLRELGAMRVQQLIE